MSVKEKENRNIKVPMVHMRTNLLIKILVDLDFHFLKRGLPMTTLKADTRLFSVSQKDEVMSYMFWERKAQES